MKRRCVALCVFLLLLPSCGSAPQPSPSPSDGYFELDTLPWAKDYPAGQQPLLRASADLPRLVGDSVAVRTINDQLFRLSVDFEASAEQLYAQLADTPPPPTPFFVQLTHQIYRNDDKLLSILLTQSSFTGGSHEAVEPQCLNFSPSTGQQLALTDLLAPEVDWQRLIDALLDGMALTVEQAPAGDFYTDWRDIATQNMTTFAVDSNTLYLFFPAYVIAPYSTGTPVFKIDGQMLEELTWIF